MKKTHLLYIVCFLLSSLLLSKGIAQDFATQWHLPEGAKARLGRGTLINVKLSPDSTRVVASTSIGIWIYDAQTGEAVSLFTESQIGGERDGFMSKTPPEALTFSLDASIIATAHGNSIYVWDTFTSNAFAMLDKHPDAINATALSPDGTKLATAGGDWTVRLWEVNTGNPIGTFDAVENTTALAFSPDGKTLASGSEAGLIQIWKPDPDYQIQVILTGHQGSVGVLMFSPDGKTLASGSYDGTILLWDREKLK